eukprot:7362421-Prymnesium_polylepis.1
MPEGLLAAAAEEAVDTAERGSVIDADVIRKSLLRFFDDADLETSALSDDEVVVAHARSTTTSSKAERLSFHVFYEGRFWQ